MLESHHTACVIWFNGELKYALEVFCCLRIRNDTEILIANMDIFEPSKAAESKPDYDESTFQWDEQEENRFDEWTDHIGVDFLHATKVTDAKVNACGDLTIELEQNIVIEAIVNQMVDPCWCLIRITDKKQFTMLGNGIEEWEESEKLSEEIQQN
jgi:hypothetical protein